VALSPKAL
jgi:hypothetical protein